MLDGVAFFVEVGGNGDVFFSVGVELFNVRFGVAHPCVQCGCGFSYILHLAFFACYEVYYEIRFTVDVLGDWKLLTRDCTCKVISHLDKWTDAAFA